MELIDKDVHQIRNALQVIDGNAECLWINNQIDDKIHRAFLVSVQKILKIIEEK